MTHRFIRIERKYKHFTKRDGLILEVVFYSRYMTNTMVQKLLFTPTTFSWCKTRLRILFDKGFLKKRDTFQNEPDVYFLGLQGRRYISKTLHLPQKYVDKVSGTPGTGKLPSMFLEHDLTLSSIYTSLRLSADGLNFTWKNDRMLELDKLPVRPDGYLELSNGTKSKEAFVEFTSVMPDTADMEKKLEGYSKLLKDQAVLWFTTSRAKVNKIRDYVRKSNISPNILVALIEDVNGIIGKPIFWNSQSETQVVWIKRKSAGAGSVTPTPSVNGNGFGEPIHRLEAEPISPRVSSSSLETVPRKRRLNL